MEPVNRLVIFSNKLRLSKNTEVNAVQESIKIGENERKPKVEAISAE